MSFTNKFPERCEQCAKSSGPILNRRWKFRIEGWKAILCLLLYSQLDAGDGGRASPRNAGVFVNLHLWADLLLQLKIIDDAAHFINAEQKSEFNNALF